jgi:beta-galactosidase
MHPKLSASLAFALITLICSFVACGGGGNNGASGSGSGGSGGGSTSAGGSNSGGTTGGTTGGSTSGGTTSGGDDGSVPQGDGSTIILPGGDGGPPGQPGPPVPPPPPNNRVLYNFDYGWKFIRMDVAGASAPSFNDSTWSSVSLPHTYNDVDTFVDWISFATDTPIMRIWSGPAWYRKHFTLDASYKGRKVFLEFQGIRNIGTFYVNGKSLGFCEDQISPCGIDITSAANFGGDNVIAVQVNNNDLEMDQTYVPGLVFDWSTQNFYPMYGGLYTDASLIVTDAIHQTLPLYRNLQTSGVYVYSSNIDTLAKSATANIQSEVFNESAAAQMVTLSVDIYDFGGNKVVSQTGTPQSIAAGQKAILTVSIPMTGVHFWAPEYPYLYTARSSIAVGGNVLDVADNPLGIRKFSFSATNGFRINGHPYWLAGFSPREVMDWSGPGIPQDWMTEYDYKLWKQANAFFIRPMHVAPRRHMVDSADRMGMIMVVPGGDSEGCPPGAPQPGPDWPQHTAVMQNVMIYFRNNPSVAFYEGCNQSLSQQQITDMKAVRDKWDPHGGRYMGARDINPSISYEYGSPMDWAARSTTIPFWSAEYAREEAPRRVWDKYTPAWDPHSMQYVTGGYTKIASPYYMGTLEPAMGNYICEYPLTDFRMNSMEDQALTNVYKYWLGYSYTNFVEPAATRTSMGIQIGGSKIFFADSYSDGRMRDTEVARVTGAVDGSRLPKEAFYALRVAASLTPDVALLGHWNYPMGTTKTVYVIASCGTGGTTPSTVTLGTYDATGKTLIKSYTGAVDTQTTNPNHYVWSFPNVAYQPGMIKASATCGTTMVTDEKVTTGAPAALKLTPVLGPKGWFADGADIAMVDFEVVDSNGLRVPTDEANVNFTYSGQGVWIGGYNSGVRESKFKPNLWTEGGINRLFVRSTTTAGTYTITATRTGLTPATITLTSTPFLVDSTGLTQNWSQRYDVTLGTEPTPIADPP